jgi:hypothetical protein
LPVDGKGPDCEHRIDHPGRIRFDKNGDPTFATHVVKIVGG